MTATYLRNNWYQAAWASELSDGFLARTLLDEPIVFFRTGERIAALRDRCPHRFAPLSAGRLQGDTVRCGYHGLTFDGSGRCVHNPYGPITEPMKVCSYPVAERHSAIWIWMGAQERADEALIPDVSFIDATPPTARSYYYIPTAANYQLATDNIMDLTHADYLHAESLGGVITDAQARVFKRDGRIVAEWINLGCTAPGLFQNKVPSPAKCDYWIEVAWQAPAVMFLTTAVVPQGQPRQPADEIRVLHNMTPETARTTHYFACGTRAFRVEDAELTKRSQTAVRHAFMNEDKPMLEAQQRRMGEADFWSLRPVILPGDAAAIRVRRELAKLIETEGKSAGGEGALNPGAS